MKKHLLVTIVALLATSGLASAQSNILSPRASASSQALSSATSASQAVSVAQGGAGGNVTFNTPSHTSADIHQRHSGTQTLRTAPQVSAPSMSSGHPCAFAPVSMGVSVIGFGGAFGGQRIDDACLLAQMGVQDASISMIAARNPRACQALEAVGRIRAGSCGGSRRAAAPVAYQPAAVVRPARPAVRRQVITNGTIVGAPAVNLSGNSIPAGSVNCVRNSSGRVVRVEHWARVDIATARRYCRG
jgi:hypothetical protein